MSKRPAWWLPVLAKIWPITWNTAKATAWPVVGKLIAKLTVPFFSDPNLNITYLPINKEIKGAESSYLPQKVVEELIRRSAHRVIINRCTCRDALQCENHPVDFGCVLLGEGANHRDAERVLFRVRIAAERVRADHAIAVAKIEGEIAAPLARLPKETNR